MTLSARFWTNAKIGIGIRLGSITIHLRLARSERVSTNAPRAPLQHAPTALSGSGVELRSNQAHRSAAPPRQSQVALIVGTGPGLGSALARQFARAGMRVAVAARNAEKLEPLIQELPALGGVGRAYGCDASDERSVRSMLNRVVEEIGVPDLVVYNVEHFIPGTLLDIETPAFEQCWRAMALGGFIVGREAARLMVPRASGTIIYTGATGALRGRAGYINMAVGKFGVRALAQSMARDLGPKGIHVAHVILDGGILSAQSGDAARERHVSLFPEHIAQSYYQLHLQHRSTWTQEMDLRPWVEKF